MATTTAQTAFFRGVYEFEDPSGVLLAARIPHSGSADLYSGTAVVVRPNQSALFLHKGQITECLGEGTHLLATENFPILTKLANWRFGMKSPVRCEIWFFSHSLFTSRRWGTANPLLVPFAGLGTIPVRGFGQYDLNITNPKRLYAKVIGSRTSLDVADTDDIVQGLIGTLLPTVLTGISDLASLQTEQVAIAARLQKALEMPLADMGLAAKNIGIKSLIPAQEVLQALEAKTAMSLIGNQRDYLLYKTANGLNAPAGDNANSTQMLLGMMLGKSIGAQAPNLLPTTEFCPTCGKKVKS